MACAYYLGSDTMGICACGKNSKLCFAHLFSTLCLMPTYFYYYSYLFIYLFT